MVSVFVLVLGNKCLVNSDELYDGSHGHHRVGARSLSAGRRLAPLMDCEPSDPRSKATIRRYPFGGGVVFFLKSPWISSLLIPWSKTYPVIYAIQF